MDDTQGKPRKTSNKIKAFFVVLLLTIIAGGYWWLQEPNIEPEINPNPTELFTIHGEFPFDKGYKLTITTSYLSTNPDCRNNFYAFGFILANSRDRGWNVDAEIVHDKDEPNKFTAKIYKDLLLPGLCGWQIEYVSYLVVKANSGLDRKLQANPHDKSQAAGRVLTQKSIEWAELRFGDIDVTCKPDKVFNEGFDGEMVCGTENENKLGKLRDKDIQSFNRLETPAIVNLKFRINGGNDSS